MDGYKWPMLTHMATNIGDLKKKVSIVDTSKLTVKDLCEFAQKDFEDAVVEIKFDEEKAYILFSKYLEYIKVMKAKAEFKKDEKYFLAVHNISKNSERAAEALASLAVSLNKRYVPENWVQERAEKLALPDEEYEKIDLEEKEGKLVRKLSNAKIVNIFEKNKKEFWNLRADLDSTEHEVE